MSPFQEAGFLETDFSACRAKEKLAEKRNKSNASPQRSPLSFLNLGEPSDPPSPPSQPSLLEESFVKLQSDHSSLQATFADLMARYMQVVQEN